MKTIDKIVKSAIAPKSKEVLWFNTLDDCIYDFDGKGGWKKVADAKASVEEIDALPEASENKDKFYRLSSDDNVYVSELKSRTSITTNRLPEAQQVDKAYLHDGDKCFYYVGKYTINCSDGVLVWYGWYNENIEDTIYATFNSVFNLSLDTPIIAIEPNSPFWSNVTKTSATTTKTIQSIENENTMGGASVTPVIATYNAPESAQIGNAYINPDSETYEEFGLAYYKGETVVNGKTVYKWEDRGSEFYTKVPASGIYCFNDSDNNVVYTDLKKYDPYSDEEYPITDARYIYIPQLNAPDSEQVGNAYFDTNEFRCLYTGEQAIIQYNGSNITVYTWKYDAANIHGYSTKRAFEIYNTTQDSADVDFYLDNGGIYKITFDDDLSEISTIKYQRTETTEEWGWLPITENIINTSYAELLSLKESKSLIPGHQYRITDFVTTAVDEREEAQFRSAGHPFDLIVQATDVDVLSAEAHAIQHDGDTYFDGVELNKWQVWYDINNDTTKYNWADADNGKGVIYRLIDEHNNDCPYDFKNIQFKRWAITDISSTSLTADALTSLKEALVYADNGNRHMANKDIYGNWIPQDVQGIEYTINEDNSGWYYTFDGISSEDGKTPGNHYDMSAHPFHLSSECIQAQLDDDCGVNYADYCKNNIIKSAYYEYVVDDQFYKGRQVLNNIVFANSMSYCYYDEEGESWNYTTNYCYANAFESECTYNTFGNDLYGNTFENSCYNNTFGNDCYNNTFGNSCQNNTFGNNCYNNTFGNDCYYNTFGNYFQNNTFGNNCYHNTFGNDCGNNTFGNDCGNNTFGNSCQNNTFGNNCYNNTFGNNCYHNTFGNYCYSNTFGNNCQYITAFEGIQFLNVTGGSTNSDFVCYAQILNGTKGLDVDNKLTISFAPNVSYTQIAALRTNGTLVIWNPAD